jgi:renalase
VYDAPMKTAVIGAGLAGLACAERLGLAGYRVTLFDKSRSAGGRMATRRVQTPLGPTQFDHGAQYFKVSAPQFAACVERWRAAGLVLPWLMAGPDAWVGVPEMKAPAVAMAATCEVHRSARIDAVDSLDGHWRLSGDGFAPEAFDHVVIALPSEQAAVLLAPCHTPFAARAAAVTSLPCWTVMLAFADRLPMVADTLRNAGSIGWAARDSAKPGRASIESWVIQASAPWSTAHLDDEPGTVIEALSQALGCAAGAALPPVIATAAHRWRYAKSGSLGEDCLWDELAGIGVCGDWLIGPRIEAAWLSGTALADRMIGGAEPE